MSGEMRIGRDRKGSYFFVLDAFIASAIFVFSVVLVFGLFINSGSSSQSFAYAADYLTFLSTTQIRDYQSPLVSGWIADRNITNTRQTISSQLLAFVAAGKLSHAWLLINDSVMLLPQEIAINVSLENGTGITTLYNRSNDAGTYDGDTHLSVRSVEYALLDQSTLYGPMILEVEVWS